MASMSNIRSNMSIKIFEGELGCEKYLTTLSTECTILPAKGELIAFEANDENDVWEVINVLHDYNVNEINIFVKRYIWPDER